MRVDHDGTLLVGKTSSATSTAGFEAKADGQTVVTSDAAVALFANRKTSDGNIIKVMFDSTTVGTIGSRGSGANLFIVFRTEANGDGCGLTGSSASNGAIIPCDGNGGPVDDHIDLGASGTRFDDIFATNGTIQTSDRNEKQDIEELNHLMCCYF